MPRRTKRGMRKTGGIAKRVKVNNESNNITLTLPVEEIVSTVNEVDPVTNLTLDLKINHVFSTLIPEMSSSTSVNVVASSASVSTSKVTCEGNTEDECSVCLHPCVHPAKLPCSHVFCYLCIKGIARIGQSCPMCRSPIPHHYADHPQLVTSIKPSNDASEETEDQEKYCWFYQGKNGGWWQFEQRMSDEIEENHSLGISCFDMMICGSLYVIDTAGCVQYPKNCPMRRRRLLRDLPSHINRIGIAGIHSVPAQT